MTVPKTTSRTGKYYSALAFQIQHHHHYPIESPSKSPSPGNNDRNNDNDVGKEEEEEQWQQNMIDPISCAEGFTSNGESCVPSLVSGMMIKTGTATYIDDESTTSFGTTMDVMTTPSSGHNGNHDQSSNSQHKRPIGHHNRSPTFMTAKVLSDTKRTVPDRLDKTQKKIHDSHVGGSSNHHTDAGSQNYKEEDNTHEVLLDVQISGHSQSLQTSQHWSSLSSIYRDGNDDGNSQRSRRSFDTMLRNIRGMLMDSTLVMVHVARYLAID